MSTDPSKPFGMDSNPVSQDPFQIITEVNWSGRVGILRAKVADASQFFLKRIAPTTAPAPFKILSGGEDPGTEHDDSVDDPSSQPDFAIGDEIKSKRYGRDYIEALSGLSGTGNPTETIYGPWGGVPVYSVAGVGFGPVPVIGPDDPRHYDTYIYGDTEFYRRDFWTGEYIYGGGYYNNSYLSWTTRIDDHPLDGLPAIQQNAAANGFDLIEVALLSDLGLSDPGGTYTAPVVNLDGSLNHIYSDPYKYGHRQWNPYLDPVRTGWLVYKLPDSDNPWLGQHTHVQVWLINFSKLGADGRVDLGQNDWHFSSPPFKDVSFACEFDLKIYTGGKLFAGADRTVTHTGGAPVFSGTQTFDWRMIGETLKSIDKNGWVA